MDMNTKVQLGSKTEIDMIQIILNKYEIIAQYQSTYLRCLPLYSKGYHLQDAQKENGFSFCLDWIYTAVLYLYPTDTTPNRDEERGKNKYIESNDDSNAGT